MKTYCCLGSYYDVPCTADCPANGPAERAVLQGFARIDRLMRQRQHLRVHIAGVRVAQVGDPGVEAIAWRAYAKAWPEAMCGYEFYRLEELAAAKARAAEFARKIRAD